MTDVERLREGVVDRLNEVLDPCALAFGANVGIVELGLVPQVEVSDEELVVRFRPTFPGCVFVPALLKAIEEKLTDLGDGRRVVVRLAPDQLGWEPAHMTDAARRELRRARGRRRSRAS
jgi:metal-sulfur cluster biosynthetic enzyme